MSSRKHRRALVLFLVILSLVISAGALSLPRAEAAPGRSGSRNAGPAVQMDLSTRTLIEIMQNLWGLPQDAHPGSHQHPGGPGPGGPSPREGTGMCPIGHPHPGGG